VRHQAFRADHPAHEVLEVWGEGGATHRSVGPMPTGHTDNFPRGRRNSSAGQALSSHGSSSTYRKYPGPDGAVSALGRCHDRRSHGEDPAGHGC
jgi:hypothetical protein